MHTLLDLRGSIPTVIIVTHRRIHDVTILDRLIIEAGAIYHRSRLSRFRSPACYLSDLGFLRDASQTQFQFQETALSHHRQINRDSIR